HLHKQYGMRCITLFCFSSRRRHTRSKRDWSSDVCSSDLEFLKERTDGLKAFKNVFKGFVDKIKDKTAQLQEKHDLEPKKNEFELTHNREVKKERSRDQGMSL